MLAVRECGVECPSFVMMTRMSAGRPSKGSRLLALPKVRSEVKRRTKNFFLYVISIYPDDGFDCIFIIIMIET